MHLYLHVPYCEAKCPYCDFNSIAGRDEEHAAYVDALLLEVGRLPSGPYDTVFIGGGTPTRLGPTLLARMLVGIRAHVRLAEGYEWTCEANPGSSDAERFAVLAEHGVNRLSIGVQSTHAHHLTALGRIHDPGQAEQALALARRQMPRVSADLIVGLEGQTDAEIDADLSLFRRHGLDHASVYHLTYEPGTEFHARRERGDLREIDHARSRTVLARVDAGLEALGLRRYETSNFARAGQEARHNLAYWHGCDYHAAGAGAVSTVDGLRVTREKHPARYIAAIIAGGNATWRSERLGPTERLREAWMLGLRLREGVALAKLDNLGDDPVRYRPRVAALAAEGLVVLEGDRLRLADSSWPLLDEIAVYLMP